MDPLFVLNRALLCVALFADLIPSTAPLQRFWEGRTIWESLLGDSRSLARLCMLYRKEVSHRSNAMDTPHCCWRYHHHGCRAL